MFIQKGFVLNNVREELLHFLHIHFSLSLVEIRPYSYKGDLIVPDEASVTSPKLDIIVHGCLTSPSDALVAFQKEDDSSFSLHADSMLGPGCV